MCTVDTQFSKENQLCSNDVLHRPLPTHYNRSRGIIKYFLDLGLLTLLEVEHHPNWILFNGEILTVD